MATEPRALKPLFQKAKTPKAGAKRGKKAPTDTATVTDHLELDDSYVLDEAESQFKKDELQRAVLGARISDDIRVAIQARQQSGIEEIWADSEDLYNGVDMSGDAPVKTRDQVPRNANGTSGRARVVVNIAKPKTDIAVSRVAEMLVPTDDKPWDLEPTPVPGLDPEKVPADRQVTLADGAVASGKAVALKVKYEAAEKAKVAATWIDDKFVEGDVYSQLRKQIRNAGRMGTGVIKGPFAEVRTMRVWEQGDDGEYSLQVKKTNNAPTSRCIRAEDCYPDPSCGEDIHRGAFFVERDFLTGKALRDLAELEGYDAPAIAMALAEGPATFAKAKSRTMIGGRRQDGNTDNDAALYEVFYYFGEVRPEDMLLMGMGRERMRPKQRLTEGADGVYEPDAELAEDAKPENDFTDEMEVDPDSVGGLTDEEMQLYKLPCIVTMLNGRPIKCDVNPQESGCFPYDFFAWDQVDGQPWGRGVPHAIATAQRGLNSAVRAMNENAGLSSGPQIILKRHGVTPANQRYEIVGRKLWYFDSDEFIDDINKVMAVFSVPSMQKELMAIIEFWMRMADTLTNLPILLQGEQQPGASPETLGGLKMFMQNASSPLRTKAKNHDDSVTKPHLKRWYDWLMAFGPAEAKGDFTVKAKGSTVLVQREESRVFLLQLLPVMQNPEFKINPEKWASELSKANGFSLTSIQYTEDELAEKAKKEKENPPPPPPQVQAAQIRAEADGKRAESAATNAQSLAHLRTEQETEDRKLRVMELQLKKEVAMLELSAKQGIALDQIKADLAKAAMNNAIERDDMQLKLNPANESGTGIAGGVGDNSD